MLKMTAGLLEDLALLQKVAGRILASCETEGDIREIERLLCQEVCGCAESAQRERATSASVQYTSPDAP